VFLSYLEGMREAYQTVNDHGVFSLDGKIATLERELENPCKNASKNPLRFVQGLDMLTES